MKVKTNQFDVTKDKPQFKHDCDGCHYLGNITVTNPDDILRQRCVDLYFCETLWMGTVYLGQRWTVIARYGNEGHEYMSGSGFSHGDSEPLTIAAQRAIGQGLLSDKEYTDDK